MAFQVSRILAYLQGITPIMFDRFAGMEEQLPWKDKVYLSSNGKQILILPSINIMSFLSAQNTQSAPQRLMGRKWKAVAQAALSFVNITPTEIPFLRDGKPIEIEKSGLWEHVGKAIVKKGQLAIPSEKHRPVLPMPWELKFEIKLIESKDLTENILKNLFELGGIQIGFGTYRGVFGKFEIAEWKAA